MNERKEHEDENKIILPKIEIETKILTKKSITFNPIRSVSFKIFSVFVNSFRWIFFFSVHLCASYWIEVLGLDFGFDADVFRLETRRSNRCRCMATPTLAWPICVCVCVFSVRILHYFITTNFDFQHSPIDIDILILIYTKSSSDSNSICEKNHDERKRIHTCTT